MVFNKAELSDSGEVVCTSGRLTSSCKLNVSQGESAPKMNFDGNVEGPVTKPLHFHVPYQGEVIHISLIPYSYDFGFFSERYETDAC